MSSRRRRRRPEDMYQSVTAAVAPAPPARPAARAAPDTQASALPITPTPPPRGAVTSIPAISSGFRAGWSIFPALVCTFSWSAV
jgi:hypothetical protein